MVTSPEEETALFIKVYGERMTRQGFMEDYQVLHPGSPVQQGDHARRPCAISFAVHLLENGADLHPFRKFSATRISPRRRFMSTSSGENSRTPYNKFHPLALIAKL
jgi:site-specific recombinase XerD